jgi:hypothetical protein
MKVTTDEYYGTLVIPELPDFTFGDIEAGVGWHNPKGRDIAKLHCYVVLGRSEDSKLRFLEEKFNTLIALRWQLCDAKDRFMMRRIHVDGRDEDPIRELRKEDGLCTYEHTGKDPFGRPQWLHKNEHWPNFRSRDRENRAAIIPVRDREAASLSAGYERLVGAIARKTTTLHASCRHLRSALSLMPYDALEHPAIKAAVWVHNAMRRADAVDKTSEISSVTYPKFSRE